MLLANISNLTISHDVVTIRLFNIFSYGAFYFVGPLLPFALFANILLVYLFVRAPLSTRKTARIYYGVVGWGELGTICFKYLWWLFLGLGITTEFTPFDPIEPVNPSSMKSASVWICPIVLFFWYWHEMIANNMFIIFQMERVTALYFPLRARRLLNLKRTLIIVMVLIVACFCITAPLFGFGRAQEVLEPYDIC